MYAFISMNVYSLEAVSSFRIRFLKIIKVDDFIIQKNAQTSRSGRFFIKGVFTAPFPL